MMFIHDLRISNIPYGHLNEEQHKAVRLMSGLRQFKKVIEIVKKFKTNFIVKYKIKKNTYKETKILNLNSSKANKKLGWKSKWDFNETLSKIIEFEKLAKLKVNYYDICLKQIKEYLKK